MKILVVELLDCYSMSYYGFRRSFLQIGENDGLLHFSEESTRNVFGSKDIKI